MLIDTHTHLDFPDFEKDFDAVLLRAKEVGVVKFINPSCNLETSRKVMKLVEKHEEIFGGVGIHPHDASEVNEDAIRELEEFAKHKKIIAIGEIGLDFFKMRNEKEIQIEAFEKQLELASKLEKVVIIHSREADDAIFKSLDKFPNLKGVFHCFGGDWDFAQKVLNKGFLIGLTAIVTFPKATNTHEVAKKIPLEKLLIETDSPFLSPQKFRGKRCESSYVLEVAKEIAKLKGISLEEVATQTTKNAIKLFNL